MWASYPGLYGSWVFYFFTVLFPIIQLTALTTINQPGYTNAAVQLTMMLMTWLFTGIVHVLGYPYVNRKFARWGHLPHVLPGASVEEAAEEVAEVVDVEEIEAIEEAEESFDDAADVIEEVADDSADW